MTGEQPRMSRAPAAFLAGILVHDDFRRDGIVFGHEGAGLGRLHWAVIDPRRHTMYVWRKRLPSFPASGRTLGATVFTSGPFTNHSGGSLLKATAKVAIDVVGAAPRPSAMAREARAASTRHYQARVPLGYVIGEREAIHETRVGRPRVHYFGRRTGSAFEDYEIAQGNPHGMTEAIGGLFRPLTNFEPYSGARTIRTAYWGLAPLVANPAARGHALEVAAGQGCTGLIVFAAARANTGRLAALLASIGVRDAVQVDGGDSLLLGRDGHVILGTLMPPWKRLLQVWGIQFRPVLARSVESHP